VRRLHALTAYYGLLGEIMAGAEVAASTLIATTLLATVGVFGAVTASVLAVECYRESKK
jgi:hypothetical protein